MMTAYQPQAGMHPGMAPHGHPGMTPGQPMNPAQMQQMGHPGASGPGAQHVSQPGAMMGMQPGANAMGGNGGMGGQHPGGQMGGMPGQMGGQSMAGGAPNAQALSHMNPQAMMQQQQQHMQQQKAASWNLEGARPRLEVDSPDATTRSGTVILFDKHVIMNRIYSTDSPNAQLQIVLWLVGADAIRPRNYEEWRRKAMWDYWRKRLQARLSQGPPRRDTGAFQQEFRHFLDAIGIRNMLNLDKTLTDLAFDMFTVQANPQLAMQQHQAAMIRRQQQMAQMQANGMMPQGGMQNLNPQQMAQMQQQLQQQQQNHPGMPAGVQLPPHMQAQQMQLQQQQRQQHQSQQMQHLAMQQANSQHSNQGGQSGPPSQQGGQPQQANQMRPQSRMANPNEQNQQTPQQAPAQTPQQQQGQPNPQQGQQPNQPQAGQPQAMTPQQMQAMQQQRQRMQMQQQRTLQAQQMAQAQQQQQQGGQMILRFILLADQLSQFNSSNGKDISNWQSFVDRHFAAEGRLVHTFAWEESPAQPRQFEVLRQTIARYFQMYFDSGAETVRLHAENARETPIPGGKHQVSFASAVFTVAYPNGARLEMHGRVQVTFTPGQEVEALDLTTTRTEEIVTRTEIEKLLSTWSPTMGNKQSPKMTKKNLPKAQQKIQSQFEGLTIDAFPRTPKGSMGIISRVQQFLELEDTMNTMYELYNYASDKQLRPEQAMEQLLQQYEQNNANPQPGNPQINLPNGMQPGARTPSMGNMQVPNAQFSSPNVSNLNLPMQNGMPMNGSPQITSNPGLQPGMMQPNSHTPSPRQANRAAPPMMPQHSQQGTNSSAASANTSPSVNNKRRRSTVKLEGDEGGGDAGPQGRVKPSPRMTKKAKPGS